MGTLVAGGNITLSVIQGLVLNLTGTGTGSVTRLRNPGAGDPYSPVAYSGSAASFGPYNNNTLFDIHCVTGTITYGIDENEESQSATLGTALQAGDAVTEMAAYITSGAGIPEDATHASLSRNPAGDDNALTFTAVAYGASGNDITIAYVDPGDADVALSVAVDGTDIVVTLETDSESAITSTAADILAAIEVDAAADALVTVAINAADSGIGDDGSGVVTALASAPMTGGEGTGIGVSLKGGLYIDITNGDLYKNTGTTAAPVWVEMAEVVI